MAYNIAILDRSEWNVWLAGQKYGVPDVRYVEDWCLTQSADLCWNLGMFNANGLGINFVRTKHGDSGYGQEGYCETLVLDNANQCNGYSNAIKNNIISINHPLGGYRTRNGIGLTVSDKVIIAQSSSKVTEKAFCQGVLSDVTRRGERVKQFILEDGGGSTSQYSNFSRLNFAPEGRRKVATVVCASLKVKPYIKRELKRGSTGEDVRLLQMLLGGIECDGSFGPGTAARLIAAEKAYGFGTGKCTEATLKMLGVA